MMAQVLVVEVFAEGTFDWGIDAALRTRRSRPRPKAAGEWCATSAATRARTSSTCARRSPSCARARCARWTAGTIAGREVVDGMLHRILRDMITNRPREQREDIRESLIEAMEAAANPRRCSRSSTRSSRAGRRPRAPASSRSPPRRHEAADEPLRAVPRAASRAPPRALYRIYKLPAVWRRWRGLPKRTDAELGAAHERAARVVLASALDLRGVIIKTVPGDRDALRRFPPAFIERLKQCHDAVPPKPFALMREAVERELGKPARRRVREFDETPIASASLAQVHGARLLDGTEVAVKVQYPDIEDIVRTDLAQHASAPAASTSGSTRSRWSCCRCSRSSRRTSASSSTSSARRERRPRARAVRETTRVSCRASTASTRRGACWSMERVRGIKITEKAADRRRRPRPARRGAGPDAHLRAHDPGRRASSRPTRTPAT